MWQDTDNIIPDESLLFRYAAGRATLQEIAMIDRWTAESEENQEMLNDIVSIYQACDALHTMTTANPGKSLKRVKEKIRRNHYRKILLKMQRVAALVLIPLLIISFFYFQRYESYKSIVEKETFVEINSAPGAVMSFTLPDGTKVWLNSNSYIKYPTHFIHNIREVTIRGEAYFSVAKDKQKPFFVSANDVHKIKVLGTEFNVEAYPNKSVVYTTLVEGFIELVSSKNEKLILDKLSPGEQSIWNTNSGTCKKKNVNTLPLTAWKEGKIIFKDNPMEEVIDILSKRYGATFIIQNQKLRKHHFTGTFTNQQLVQILEHFKISSNIRYEISGHELNHDGTIKETTVILK